VRETSGTTSRLGCGIRGGNAIVALASLVGLSGFLYPFALPVLARGGETSARAGDAPFLLAIVTVLCLLAIVAEFDRGNRFSGASAKTVALLGSLVAIDATLRLVPTFLGASPIFLLVVLTGFVYGPAIGFQMGVLTLLVSAFLTGGIGPWLPYQMLGTGWIGLTAGWLPHPRAARHRVWLLAGFGAVWGLLFGLLLNLWFWPVTAPGAGANPSLYWTPGLGLGETFHRYAAFYAVTSFGYDLFRAAGNALLLLLLGGPVLVLLERYRDRFSWTPWSEISPAAAFGSAPDSTAADHGGPLTVR
jgi:energy-coupling factor transport system substrate-specific component